MMSGPDEDVDLAMAALYIAGQHYSDLDIGHYSAMIAELGAGARTHVGDDGEPEELILRLSHYLYVEQGFQGNRNDYYDPDNSYLNQVLDRRLGIPILLSLVHMEIGKYVGLSFQGIGLPGHFIIRSGPPEQELYVDPFEGGILLSRSDCERRVLEMFRGRVQLQDQHLVEYTRKQQLGRILNNLKHIYRSRGDYQQSLLMADMAYMTDPAWMENLKDRAWLHHHLGHYRLAISDLQRCLDVSPGAPDEGQIQEQIKQIWEDLARAN